MASATDTNATPDATALNHLAQEEAVLLEAMQRLKLLHVKERMLRDVIPTMLGPLVQKTSPPEVMFASFMKALNEAQMQIQEFTDLMRDDVSRAVFARAEKSRKDNPAGIRPWRHQDHPNWFNLSKN